jgi:hypothetical protein
MPDHTNHSEIVNMHMDQSDPGRNAPQRISPQQRARVCRALHRYIEIEATLAATAKRNARLRMAIGLPPIPRRTVDWKRYQ